MAALAAPPPQPRSPIACIGLIALAIVLVVIVFLGFTKDIPFTHGVPASRRSSSRRTRSGPNSPVRIAGVEVGKVKSIEPQRGHQRRRCVMMEINDDGAADPRGRDGQDPPAHLPRGQLLRRPQAGHAGVAASWTPATRSRSRRRPRRCSSTRC